MTYVAQISLRSTYTFLLSLRIAIFRSWVVPTVLLFSSICYFICTKQIQTGTSREKLPLNFTFSCIDDVLSLNNSKSGDFVDRIQHQIKETTDTDRPASYISKLTVRTEKERNFIPPFLRDDFNYHFVNQVCFIH